MTWEECGRDDLNMIPKMIAAGWTPLFSTSDAKFGRITPDNCPLDTVEFTKDDSLHTRKNYRIKDSRIDSTYWRVWKLDSDYWRIIADYETLEELISDTTRSTTDTLGTETQGN